MADEFDLATDIWDATFQKIMTGEPKLATFAYRKWGLFNLFFQNAKTIIGGDQLEGNITMDSEGNARLVGAWEQDSLVKKNINAQYTAKWRHARGGMMWNLLETSVNAGDQKIFNVLKTQFKSGMKDLYEAVYLALVTGLTSASDYDSPNSINTWLRVGTASSTGGWTGYQSRYNDGSTPGTAYDTGGLTSSSSVNTGWASYYADHLGNIDESLLSLLDVAILELGFQAPSVGVNVNTDLGLRVPDFSMYSSKNVHKTLNTFYAKADDNMGYNKNSHWGTPTFMSIPFAYCDLLNTARTSLYGTDPIFGINHSDLYPVIHSDWNFETVNTRDPNRSTVLKKIIWLKYQMWCDNPHDAGFLISQHPSS